MNHNDIVFKLEGFHRQFVALFNKASSKKHPTLPTISTQMSMLQSQKWHLGVTHSCRFFNVFSHLRKKSVCVRFFIS